MHAGDDFLAAETAFVEAHGVVIDKAEIVWSPSGTTGRGKPGNAMGNEHLVEVC